ncbi:hypothetical protein [Legionella saoudiensis]|uniref:hypothetical protein n=1 Tax=Legionella saoudiensis TaxID=1750561 RepID=UPI000730177C|nr:hypothetical protein [Legionella saoudiensis]
MNEQTRGIHSALKQKTEELAEQISNAKTNKTQGAHLPGEASTTPVSEKIPGFIGFLHSLTTLGNGLTSIAQLKRLPRATNAGNTFSIIDAALSGINFISMPLIYFSSLLAGEKPSFPISTPMKWAYSGVVFGLALAGILAPAVAGLPIALTGASLGIATSLLFLGQDIYNRYKASREAAELTSKIEATTEALENNLKNNQELLAQLEAPGLEEAQITGLKTNIEKNNESMTQHLETMKQLNERKQNNESVLSELGVSRFIGNTVGITLSLVALAGLVLIPFFPPAGLALLAATSITGGLLTVTPACVKGASFIYETIKNRIIGQASEPDTQASTNNSTAQMLSALTNTASVAVANRAAVETTNDASTVVTNDVIAIKANQVNIDEDDDYLTHCAPSL